MLVSVRAPRRGQHGAAKRSLSKPLLPSACMSAPNLTDAFSLGPLRIRNRVLLAPLAGIGNWFVRLQALRHGAGMAVSEMVSSHAIYHRNARTCNEMLRIHPREQALGPVSI